MISSNVNDCAEFCDRSKRCVYYIGINYTANGELGVHKNWMRRKCKARCVRKVQVLPKAWSLSVLSSYFQVVHRLHMTKASKQSPHWTAMNCNSVLELVLKAVLEQNAKSECLLCLEVSLQSKWPQLSHRQSVFHRQKPVVTQWKTEHSTKAYASVFNKISKKRKIPEQDQWLQWYMIRFQRMCDMCSGDLGGRSSLHS